MPYAPARIPYTYEEYRQLPDDGRRYEIIDGDLFVTPAPATFHQMVSSRLLHALMTQLQDPGVALVFHAPCDLILAETTVVQPDLVVVRATRKETISKRAIEAPPDLVVEILSPSTRDRDLHIKRQAYARFGIPEYWVVDPELGFVEVRALEQDGYGLRNRFDRASTLSSIGFPEVAIPLSPIFREL